MSSEKIRDAERLEMTVENAGWQITVTPEIIQRTLRELTICDRVRVTDLYWFKPTGECRFDVTVDPPANNPDQKPFRTSFTIRANEGIPQTLQFAAGWLVGMTNQRV